MKIKYINHGMACKIGDTIYLNEKLKSYEKLHHQLLEHEKEHSDNFDFRDIIIDFQGKHLREIKKEYYKFILKHPSSWTMFLPFGYYNKNIVLDPLMFFVWGLLIANILILIYVILI